MRAVKTTTDAARIPAGWTSKDLSILSLCLKKGPGSVAPDPSLGLGGPGVESGRC